MFLTPIPLLSGRSLWAALIFLCAFVVARALPVFPGAVGFGTDTPAGRGGQIVRVTNLSDDYQNPPEGSLRWAIEKVSGPRVIIFEVAGVIELRRYLIIRADDGAGHHGSVTIAGQTAPWPGITLKNAGIVIAAEDVLIQHLAIRPGTLERDEPGWNLPPLDNRDCIAVGGAAGAVARNVVIDHVSASWATDEMVSVWADNGGAENITFSNCIFAHPILNGGHSKGAHGFGPLSGRNAANVTIARNLMAYQWGRNPLVRDRTTGAQVVNNFIYRPGVWPNSTVYLAGPESLLPGIPIANTVAGNVIVRHPIPFSLHFGQSDGTIPLETYTTYYNTSIYVHNDMPDGSEIFLADNRVYNPQDATWYPTDGDAYSSSIFRQGSGTLVRLDADPYAGSGGTDWSPWPAVEVEDRVLARAGKFPAHPDLIDARTLNEAFTRTGAFTAFESDLGAAPWAAAEAEVSRPLTIPANPHDDDDGDGYTNLEEWLHAWSDAVESFANRQPYADAGPNQFFEVDGVSTVTVNLNGRDSFDLDGDPLTYTWTWSGGSATGEAVSVPLPLGRTNVTLTVSDDHGGTASDTLEVEVVDPPETIALGNLDFAYDGQPKAVAVTTFPEQLSYEILYDGTTTPPVLPGTYAVVATVTDPGYEASAEGTLVIRPTALIRRAPVLNANFDGSLQMTTAENVTINGNGELSGHLLLPGTPAVHLNGSPQMGSVIDGPGLATPNFHRVTLNGGALLGGLVRRVDGIALPMVEAPAEPTGTRNVYLNHGGDAVGDFATLRNLTLNGGSSIVDVPPGTYGSFTANSGGFRLGVAGTDVPAVYELQRLTLNGNSRLELVGAVVLTLAQGGSFSGVLGASEHPEWLTLRVAAGGVTLNGGGGLHGSVIAPAGTITLNGGVVLRGSATADRLVLNGAATLQTTADRTPPTVAISAPVANELLRGTVALEATATDEGGIAAVQFIVDGVPVGLPDTVAPYSVAWDTTTVPLGAHQVTAEAHDHQGNRATSTTVTVIVADQEPPEVSVVAPAPATTLNGDILLRAEAVDNVGVATVTFQVDGNTIGAPVTAPPFELVWDSTTVANGRHAVTALAADAAGNETASAALELTIWNGAADFVGFAQNFDDGDASVWAPLTGNWAVDGGAYVQLSAATPAIALFDERAWDSDFLLAARLRTTASDPVARIGLVYNFVDADNYGFVRFNAAGVAEIGEVSGGMPALAASADVSAIGSGVAFDVEVARAGVSTTVLVNGETVFAGIVQRSLARGQVGLLAIADATARFDDVSMSAHGPVAVFDTFEDGDVTAWFSDGLGTWGLSADGTRVLRQSDPSVFANRAVRDGTDRADQAIEADVRVKATNGNNRFFGVVARYVDDANYYYFILRTGNRIELKELVAGRAVNLTPPLSYPVSFDTWYRLRLEVVGDTLKAYVNGELLMEATSPSFASGRSGLLTFFSDVEFDDVHIDADPDAPLLAADDFEDGDAVGWFADAGTWAVEGDENRVYRQGDLGGAAATSIGSPAWSDLIVELDVKPEGFGTAAGEVGVSARRVDADNCYSAVLTAGGTIELRRRVAGVSSVLASVPFAVIAGEWHALRLTAVGNSLKVYVDGVHTLEAVDDGLAVGGVGLITEDAGAAFDDVLITAP